MSDIDKLRKEIEEIDESLMMLLERRFELARSVGEYKRVHGLPVEDPDVEASKRRGWKGDLEEVFNVIVKVARNVQRRDNQEKALRSFGEGGKKVRVAIMGEQGSFTEEAALQYLKEGNYQSYDFIYPVAAVGVLQAVEKGEADLAVFPIYNEVGGMVQEALYAMAAAKFSLEELFGFEVKQCLMALPGASRDGINRIMSHPHALDQCQGYLAKEFGDRELVKASDTAGSARILSERGKDYKSTAVIAPKSCAELYGLELLEEGIQDLDKNDTQFVVARR